MVIDALAREFSKGAMGYDRDGRIAASGKLNHALLDELLADPYYRRTPPKSAGREQYGAEFVNRMKSSGVSLPDLIATATALTAATIAMGIHSAGLAETAIDLIVSGGGAHNPQIMARLAALLPQAQIVTSADFGIDVDGKEAIAFAVLAYRTWLGKPANLPSATGAGRAVVLGDVTR
jgi:anhydro-N-acetylmuramic acid kinase